MKKSGTPATNRADNLYPLPTDTPSMEAKSAASLPSEGKWQFEPKWDGFRCLVFKHGKNVDLRAKSGKPLGRYFPEVVAMFEKLDADGFVIDGELVIEIDGHLGFDALQMRLHPAESRIRKLSVETPARFVMFDMLVAPGGEPVIGKPLSERRGLLEHLAEALEPSFQIRLSPMSLDLKQAQRWLADSGPNGTDCVVAKSADGPYLAVERAMVNSSAFALRTVLLVVSDTRAIAMKSARCCWVCSTTPESSTTSGSLRRSRTRNGPH
jgi:ATP-dependent DNA ligase